MTVDDARGRRDDRLSSLLGELRETSPPGADIAGGIVRRARRQQSLLAILGLVVAVARTVPHAVVTLGRRR